MGHTDLSIPTKQNAINPPDSCDLFIRDTVQIGSLKMGYSTLEDAKKEFGLQGEVYKHKNKKRRGRWHNSRWPQWHNKCYNVTWYTAGVIDSVKGIFVHGYGRDLPIIDQIDFKKKSNWKTKNGIGIGSTFSEIEKAWGKPTRVDTSSAAQTIYYETNICSITLEAYIHDLVFIPRPDGIGLYPDPSIAKCDTIKKIQIKFHFSMKNNFMRKDSGPIYKKRRALRCPPSPCTKC